MIGAAHAGWRGAFTGVIEATVAAMEKLGASRETITVALGPTIRQANYEVGPEFVERFLAANANNARFFSDAERDGHAMFDLTGYIAAQVKRAGVVKFEDLGLCTYADPERFFSFRRVDSSQRAGLRASHQCHRARRLKPSATSGFQLPFGWTPAHPSGYLCAGRGVLKTKNTAAGVSMALGFGRRTLRAMEFPLSRLASVIGCAIALSGCMHDGPMSSAAAPQPHGATVAFESIDGLPPNQFKTLVQDLNDEAQSRRLAVISRDDATSAYRVRGYLAAKIDKGQTTIAWVWDVFDRNQRRALRIDGQETANETPKTIAKERAKGPQHDGWNAADDAMLHRIAHSSMDQLAAFLTSPGVAPATTETAFTALGDTSPEAAGIFRIFHAKADPTLTEVGDAPAASGAGTSPVPLPPHRPSAGGMAVSARDKTDGKTDGKSSGKTDRLATGKVALAAARL